MKSKPPRDRAASVRQRLLNIAKERGEEFNFVLLRYGLERLLFRLGQSRYAGTFVLTPQRPTLSHQHDQANSVCTWFARQTDLEGLPAAALFPAAPW